MNETIELDDFDFEKCYEHIKKNLDDCSNDTVSVCGLIGEFLAMSGFVETNILESHRNRTKIFKVLAPVFGWSDSAQDIYIIQVSKPIDHIKLDFDIFKNGWKND